MKKQQHITTQTNKKHLLSENKLMSDFTQIFKTMVENFLAADALEWHLDMDLKVSVWEDHKNGSFKQGSREQYWKIGFCPKVKG